MRQIAGRGGGLPRPVRVSFARTKHTERWRRRPNLRHKDGGLRSLMVLTGFFIACEWTGT